MHTSIAGKKLLRWALLILLLVFLHQFLWPRQYKVAVRKHAIHAQQWQLSTGSVIGFTFIPSAANKRQANPIIYLHGGPGGAVSKKVMDDLQPLANEGFDLYFYDQVGSGHSSRLSNITAYTVQRHIDDLHAIIKKINADKVILIGQSWGAILATAYLAQHPQHIAKIIFTSPGPFYPINKTELNRPAPDSLQLKAPLYTNKQANNASSNMRSNAIRFFATRFGKKIASDKEADEFADFLDTKTYKSALCDTSIILVNRGGNGYFAGIMTYKSLLQMKDYRAAINGSAIPVLVMKGQCDNQPWGATNEYLHLFPHHTFSFIPDAGHFINVEQHDRYIDAMKDFLLQ